MASSKRDGGVKPKDIARRPSAPQAGSPTKHSPIQSSPLRKSVTYGKDVFSESENDSDADGVGGAGDGNVGNDKKSGDTHRQQATPSASVAGPSTQGPRIIYASADNNESFNTLVTLVVREVKRINDESLGISRPIAVPQSLATPPSTPHPDQGLREDVADLLSLMYPCRMVPHGGRLNVSELARLFIDSRIFLNSLDDEGNPPPGAFDVPGKQSQQQAFTLRQTQQTVAESTANLPPQGSFTPTGKTLQDLRDHPIEVSLSRLDDDNDGEFAQLRSLVASNSAPLPPTGTFAPPGQTLHAHRQSQQQPSQPTSSYPNEDFSRAIAAANAVRTAQYHPSSIPHVPTKHEDTSKLDILAAVALGQFDPANLLHHPTASSSATVSGFMPGNNAIPPSSNTAQSTKDKKGKKKQNTVDASSDTMVFPIPPLPPPTRRRAPQRRAALKSQELSRKMATKSELRKLVQKNAEKNAAKDAEKNDDNADAADNDNNTIDEASSTAEAGSSSSNIDNPKPIDPATGQPYAQIDMGDHVFHDIPHEDSFFPHPKASVLKKAIAVAGDPQEPEFVKRHTERYYKRLELNTFQWPESNVRGATDDEAAADRRVKDNLAMMVHNTGKWGGLTEQEAERHADFFSDDTKKKALDKGKQRATSFKPEADEKATCVSDDDENATVIDSDLTVTDRRAAQASAERNKLLCDAINVWQNNEEIRDYYNNRTHKKTQHDLRQVNDLFNSRLSFAAKGGEAPTPPPEAQSATAASSTHLATVAAQKPMPLPTPEASFTGEGSASQSFNFRMPKPKPNPQGQKSGDDIGLDGTCDVQSQPQGSADAGDKKDARGKIVYEEVDFEIDNPVSPLPRGPTNVDNKSKKTRGARHQNPDAPVNKTSKIGDDPFYYDPRFDPTDVYPGVLNHRYPKKRHLVPGDAASRERVAAFKKREEEEAEELKRKREMEILNEPIEALLKQCMGDAYVEPQNRPHVPGSATGGPSYSDMYADFLNSRDNAVVEEEEGEPSGDDAQGEAKRH